MATFSIELYFHNSLDREEALRRLQSLPEQQPDPDGPEMGWSGRVHWSIATWDHQHSADRIQRSTGMTVGDFSTILTIFVPENDIHLEQWDRVLDLLEYGDDAVAIYQSADILLTQKSGNLTLDSQSDFQSDLFREHVQRRRKAQVHPLGALED